MRLAAGFLLTFTLTTRLATAAETPSTGRPHVAAAIKRAIAQDQAQNGHELRMTRGARRVMWRELPAIRGVAEEHVRLAVDAADREAIVRTVVETGQFGGKITAADMRLGVKDVAARIAQPSQR